MGLFDTETNFVFTAHGILRNLIFAFHHHFSQTIFVGTRDARDLFPILETDERRHRFNPEHLGCFLCIQQYKL